MYLKVNYTYRLFLFAVICLSLSISGCSKKKAGFTNKLYHHTTSHYNGYFNAREIMSATITSVNDNYEDDYLELIPVFRIPTEEGSKALYPEMDKVIDKCSVVIDRHSMEIKKKEHNKWIDENFILIGKANYYKRQFGIAIEMFDYVAKKYKDQEGRFEASLWLARSHIELGEYAKASTILNIVNEDKSKDKPKYFVAEWETITADMLLRQERYADAINHLKIAADAHPDKDMRARLTYIIAQTYQKLNRSQDAIDYYVEVVKMRPEYEMEFYAKISQAMAFNRKLDSSKIKAMLLAMAGDEKNIEYYDQVYYALAEIELEEQNDPKAIEYLITSTEKSISNNKQKGKSFLRLADLYFTDRDYRLAKDYYDSTATFLPEDYPNYETIKAKGESLEELVANIIIVEREDSLLAMANMDQKDREKKILKMIASIEAEEEAERRREAEALAAIQAGAGGSGKKGNSNAGSGKNWYFYNTSTLSAGFSEFKRQWGNRKLEDNWRRSNKSSRMEDFADGSSDSLNLGGLAANASKAKSLEEYLADIPLSDSAQTASNEKIVQALYNIGLIYKEQLSDDDNAIESFLRITSDFPESEENLNALYQLYRIYLTKEESGSFTGTGYKDNSNYYKDYILSDYPTSVFAELIKNPDYIADKDKKYMEEKSAYENTYTQYNRRQYSDVLIASNTVINDEPENNFLPKYYMIKALSISALNDAGSYENILKEIIAKFPNTEEGDKATEMLQILNKAKAEMNRNEALSQKMLDPDADEPVSNEIDAPPASSNTSMYSVEDDGEHFFALIFPKTEADATTLKETISDFNTEYYRNADLRITNSFIDKDHQIIIVRSFPDKAGAMDYFESFNVNNTILKSINDMGFQKFTITTKNFTSLFRNKNADVYQEFFNQNYL